MAAYQVLLSKAARKQLNILPVFMHNKIIEDIAALTHTPRPAGCKKLKGNKNAWRIGLAITELFMKLKISNFSFWLL